jgi:hypothetical protein
MRCDMIHALSKLLGKNVGTRCANRSIMVGLRYTQPTNHRKSTRCLTPPPQSYAGMAALFGASAARSKKRPQDTNVDYCIYHHAHGDYTYSENWVEHLVAEIADEGKWAAIKAYKI